MFFQYIVELFSPAVLALWIRAHIRLSIAGGLLVSLLLWRVAKFTVLPLFYPNDPKQLPYWIPGEPLMSLISEYKMC